MLDAIFITGVNEIKVSGLFQWDRGQMLQITCPNLPSDFQVHFAKRKSKTSIDVQAKSADNVATVAIPDTLLQDRFDLYAYLYFDEGVIGETVKTIRLPITPREKPDDYVIDLPQEQMTDAEKLIDKMMGEYVEEEVGAASSASESAAKALAAAEEAAKAAADAKAVADSIQGAAVDVAAAEAARKAAEAAQTAAETAKAAAEAAAELAATDAVSQVDTKMADYVSAAQAAQAAAEKARDDAQAVAGGNFASTEYVDQKAASAESNANQYTDQKIAAIPTPDVSGQIGVHNTATDAHNDIRLLITELTTRFNALANSTDVDLDQLAELVAYIKDNRSLIEQITTNKVNVSDIIDNLTTNVSNKPLSAAQGVALKALIDAVSGAASVAQNTANAKQDKITGSQGQVVGFDANGNPVAQSAPSGEGIPVVNATSTDGINYTATVDGVTSYDDIPLILIVPNMDSVQGSNIYLNINGLGNVLLTKRRVGSDGGGLVSGDFTIFRANAPNLLAKKPAGNYENITTPVPWVHALYGTFGGVVSANANAQDPATSLLRNNKLMDAATYDAVTDWSSHLSNGEIAWRYG